MKSITSRSCGAILLVISCQSTVTLCQISSPTKGAENPDDYADAVHKLENEIGSGSAAAARNTPKKLHKRANGDPDELKMFKSQIEERRKKKKKGTKATAKGELRLSPEEIATKTDEELLEVYYMLQSEKKARVDERHQRVTETLKDGDLTPDEREKHLKQKEMIELRKQRMFADDEMEAKRVSIIFALYNNFVKIYCRRWHSIMLRITVD